jgi:hypothetical protein
MDAQELLRILPVIEDQPALTGETPGLTYISKDWVKATYIAPDMSEVAPVDWKKSGLLLVEAPAATGKSALAKFIASRTGAPLWDLANDTVGKSSLSGSLQDELEGAASRLLGRSESEADMFIVLDALDEAEMRATAHGFEQFLQNVARRLGAPTGRCRCVILARLETALQIAMHFDSVDQPYNRLVIENFTNQQSFSFIEERVRDHAHRKQSSAFPDRDPDGFSSQVNELFEQIAEALGSNVRRWDEDAELKRFLGYAPVLEVIADALLSPTGEVGPEQSDWRTRLAQQGGGTARPEVWRIMMAVSEAVLRREQSKVAILLRERLDAQMGPASEVDWDSIMPPSEQIKLATQWVAQQNPLPDCPSGMIGAAYEHYCDIVKERLPQHPFVGESGASGRSFANLVFKNYAEAQLLLSGRVDLQDLARSNELLPLPMIGRFVMLLAAADRTLVIRSADLRRVHDSLLVSMTGSATQFSIRQDDEHGYLLFAVKGDGFAAEAYVDAGSGNLALPSRMLRINVAVQIPVRIGNRDLSASLGPDVRVEAPQVSFGFIECQLYCSDGSEPVIFESNAIVLDAGYVHLTGDESGLELWVDEVPEQLTRFRCRLPDAADERVMWVAARLMGRFSGVVHGGLQSSKQAIAAMVGGDAGEKSSILNFLIAKGVIRSVNNTHYSLDPDSLRKWGVSFDDIKRRNFGSAFQHLSRDYKEWTR